MKKRSIFGLILGAILLIVTGIFLFLVKRVIPNKYLIPLEIILVLMVIIMIIIMIIKKSNIFYKIIRVLCFIGTFLLLGIYSFTMIYLNKTFDFIKSMAAMREEVTNYYIIVLKDSRYQEISDLYGTTLSYSENIDKSVLDKIKLDLSFSKENTMGLLKEKLFNKETDAIIISDIVKTMLEEDYPEFKDTRILETIELKTEIEDITKSVNMKNTPFNILISGIDTYGDINRVSRNDVNIVVTVNPNTNEILLTSIPRDYYVQLHGTTGYKDKLTHASVYGNNMAIQTIEDILDIDINYYVKVNFTTVVELVDQLGGIEVYADMPVNIGKCNFKQGMNKVDGKCALAFSRERHSYIDGDRHRGRNQQEVIKAIFNKMSNTSTILTEYLNILEVMKGKFATDIDLDEILKFIKYEIPDLNNYSIMTTQLDGYGASEKTYSYPYRDLYVMVPYEETIVNANNLITKMLNNESIRESF